jgi:hypothetical protein
MKTSIASRTRIAARVGVTLAALAAFGCAADDPGMPKTSSLTAPLPSIDAISTGAQQCDSNAAAHTLSLQDPHGAKLELVYVPGCGWQYTAQKSGSATAMSALQPISASHAASPAQPENPLAIFIDGPTGYAFAWTRDAGWKFIGHVDEHK